MGLLEQPHVYRRARLEALLKRAECNLIRFSEGPSSRQCLPGRVRASRIGGRSGATRLIDLARCGWIKVKTNRWGIENKYRAKISIRKVGSGLR
jgi:hypothetical protein